MTMIYTGATISFQVNGKFMQAHKTHPSFTKIVELAKQKKYEEAARLIDLKTVVTSAIKGTKAELRGNAVYYNGEQVHGVLGQRIVQLAQEGFDAKPLLLFLDNLMANPSKRAVEELYGFLEASKLPITEDGHFLAYKSVRQDYKDHHSGTMDNSVGRVVSMERNKVDEDKDRTCSYGLHFAAHEYAKGFGRGGRMVVLKINPRDVVAIPSDYNNQKGRCCRYEVIEEVGRDDTKLVNKSVVTTSKSKDTSVSFDTPKSLDGFTVGDTVYITPSSEYFTSYKNNPKGVKGTIVDIYDRIGYPIQVQWENGAINDYHSYDLQSTKPKYYLGEVDNYSNKNRWKHIMGLATYVSDNEHFPANRTVPYILERKSTKKVYRGEWYFREYDDKGHLKFIRFDGEGNIDRWLTISDTSDWYIQSEAFDKELG